MQSVAASGAYYVASACNKIIANPGTITGSIGVIIEFTNFEKLFQLFFEGGTASLKLVGDPDPLEADIGIEAQPPGKRNTSFV